MKSVSLGLAALSALLAACTRGGAPGRSERVATSTLDPRVQTVVRAELDRAVAEWQPHEAFAVVLEASTGAILAMEGREAGRDAPTLAASRAYVTGSTFKTLTVAAALDRRAVTPDARVGCATREYGKVAIYDGDHYACHGTISVGEVITLSSNVGVSRVLDAMGLDALMSWVRRAHVGEPPGHLPAIADGASIEAGLFAGGELGAATVTPLQVAAAYAAIVNGGEYLRPTFTRAPANPERLLRADTAATVVGLLEAAVGDAGTGKLARVPGLRVAGKTGTAELRDGDGGESMYSSFIGTVLDREPRYVALVGLVAPREGGTGPKAAAPIFARIAASLAR
jgi:cell division protein FtsI (penicillin-binding protein 3)